MFEEEDRETGYAVFIAVTVAIVVSLFVLAIAIGNVIGQAGSAPASARSSAPSLVRIIGLVYFDLGKSDLPDDAMMLLGPAIRVARTVPSVRLVVSGYHDASGDAAANEELAKRRAFAVRDALISTGIGAERIVLVKPLVAKGGEDPREARRVEITAR